MEDIHTRWKIYILPAIVLLFFLAFVSGFVAVGKEQNKEKMSIGDRFHYETSLTWTGAIADVFRAKPKKPPQYKSYPSTKKIELPKPTYTGISVEDAIKKRRSVRNYSKEPLSKAQLSQLLFAAHGVTGKMYNMALRSVPSAGALYPFEVYIVANNVQDLPSGIYHYSILDHALELVKAGDFRHEITDAGLKQEMLGDAAVTFVLSAIFDRTRHKYGQRGLRYVYIEAGHISQNIYLQSVSLGLGSVCVGAFLDEKVNKLIDIDGHKEAAIYLHAVGCI